ncbi:hypothetical protein [Streptomyces cellostaticus]|uniref:hypothetical protein n=1 Tax=Streptomyces cellostaticus TaxID=67285 RepID=UPI000ACFB5E9|nr:hypothetical protein [Streptomyces cellostaticus]
MTHTPWPPASADGRVHRMPLVPGSSGAADQPARGSADFIRQLVARAHELTVAAERDGDEARGLARRLAASLSPEARLVLLSALIEADALPENDRPAVHRSDRPTGPGTGLSIVPAYQEPGPDRPAGDPDSGDPESDDPEFWRAPRNDPPDGLIRLRFADAIALERAGDAFGAGSAPGLGDALSDPATLTLQIPGDAGIETLRAVLAVLDAAAITAVSLTVHTRELDDIFAAFTSLP